MTDPETPPSGSRLRATLAAAAGVVAVVPVIVGLLLSGGGGATARAVSSTSASKPFAPVVTKKVAIVPRRLLPAGTGALVAAVNHGTQMRSAPGGGRLIAKVGTTTVFGSAQ